MEVKIDINDYLSDSDKVEIARKVFTEQCREEYRKDHERIFGDVAYKVVTELVNQEMDLDLIKLIRKKTEEVIKGLSSYTVFNAGGTLTKEKPTLAWLEMERVIKENPEAIKDRVLELIKGYDIASLRSLLESKVCEAFSDIFSNKQGD